MEEIKMMIFAVGMVSAIPLTAVAFKLVVKAIGLTAVDKSIQW